MLESYTQQVMERCFTLYNRKGIWTKTTMTWCYTLRMSNTSEIVEQEETLSLFGRIHDGIYKMKNNLHGLYKTKHSFTMWSGNHFLGLYPYNLSYICMFLHGHLMNNFPTWEELRSFLPGEFRKKLCYLTSVLLVNSKEKAYKHGNSWILNRYY